jgi:hypothetical protein
VNQQLLVKMNQFFVANLVNRMTRADPMSKAIALGLHCDSRLDLIHFKGASE